MIYTLYIIVVFIITIYLTGLSLLSNYNRCRNNHLCDYYIDQVSAAMLHDNNTQASAIVASSYRARTRLIEALYIIVSHCYDINMDIVSTIVHQNHLDTLLTRQLRFATKRRRAMLWFQLATIAPAKHYTSTLKQELYSHNTHLRSCALIALLNSAPKESIKNLKELKFQLPPHDIARIITLVRRGALPLAIDPLLQSEDYNLKSLALTIIRVFNLDISIKHIYPFISREENPALIHEAIYTIASLKHPLNSQHIKHRIAYMSNTQRKALCRHLSAEGYSLCALQSLFSYNEIEYAKQIITSYKRELTYSDTRLQA